MTARLGIDRREFLLLAGVGASLSTLFAVPAAASPRRLLLVHGRSQQGNDPEDLKANWLSALRIGAQAAGGTVPDDLQVAFPFYGDLLDGFAGQFEIPLTSDIHTRGSDLQEEFLAFQAEVAEEIRKKSGVTDAQVDEEYGANPKPRGPLNWEWVQAILRAIDKFGGGATQVTVETFTRDVFLYTTRAGVRDVIDDIVGGALTEEPTVVVGHSLGSVVAYNVLRADRRDLQIPIFVTVGSPLGLRPIRNQFRPLKYPAPVRTWYNAYDDRDLVALYPLDLDNFPVTPDIENYAEVRNHTDNRHGIAGYLDDAMVAKRIIDGLTA